MLDELVGYYVLSWVEKILLLILLNQVHVGLWLVCAWFLEITFCAGRQYVCVCVSVSTSEAIDGVIWISYDWLITFCCFSVPIYGLYCRCKKWAGSVYTNSYSHKKILSQDVRMYPVSGATWYHCDGKGNNILLLVYNDQHN